jgi:hypothetical protein
MTAGTSTVPGPERRRGVRRTALLLGLVAAAFYVGFIVMMIARASK